MIVVIAGVYLLIAAAAALTIVDIVRDWREPEPADPELLVRQLHERAAESSARHA